jgi:hypothetical protein
MSYFQSMLILIYNRSYHIHLLFQARDKEYVPLQSGYLMAEPYSWKSLVTGQPMLRIHTTSTRAALLTLPPG